MRIPSDALDVSACLDVMKTWIPLISDLMTLWNILGVPWATLRQCDATVVGVVKQPTACKCGVASCADFFFLWMCMCLVECEVSV